MNVSSASRGIIAIKEMALNFTQENLDAWEERVCDGGMTDNCPITLDGFFTLHYMGGKPMVKDGNVVNAYITYDIYWDDTVCSECHQVVYQGVENELPEIVLGDHFYNAESDSRFSNKIHDYSQF